MFVEISALANDNAKIDSMRSVSIGRDLPNGITGDFETSGRYSEPSYIKFCDVRIFESLKAENMEEVLKGKYKEHKFETVKGLEIPVPFKSIEIAETSHQGVGRDIGSLYLDNCSSDGCDLANANLTEANLTRADLTGASGDGSDRR